MYSDDLLKDLMREIELEENGAAIINPVRLQEFCKAYAIIQQVFYACDVGIKYKLHKPYPSVGYIRITGSEIPVNAPQLFHEAISLASNLSVTPMIDGTVEIDLTFHDLTVDLPELEDDDD